MGGVRARATRRHAALASAVLVAASAWAVVLPAGSASGGGWSPHLLRYPYVTEVVGTAATVAWGTDQSQPTGSATWGAVSGGTCTPTTVVGATAAPITVGATAEYQWQARLSFPGPGTYCVRVQLAGTDLLGSASSLSVPTAAAPGTPFSFAVVGDWGAATAGEAAVMSAIGSSPASFVVTAGDNVYNAGTDTEYGDLASGAAFRAPYLPAIGSRPIFGVQGNHGFSANAPFLRNFPAPTAALSSGGRNLAEDYCCLSTMSGSASYASSWYAFDWGGARFYILEAAWADSQGDYQGDFLGHWNGPVSGCGPCGAELAWLKADLAAHAATAVKFAFFHYPLHSDASGQSSDPYLDGPAGLEGLLAANNVGVAFNGHAHVYERNTPQIPGTQLVSYITGTGGDPLGVISTCSAFDAYALGSASSCRAPKPTSDAHVFGYLLVTVSGSQVTVAPTDSTGATFDVQTYRFTATTVAPDTVIDSGPAGLTAATSATVAFHASQAGATFTCRVDAGAAGTCTSPFTASGLAQGTHTIAVAATSGGLTDATPATVAWTVDTTAPTVPTGVAALASGPGSVNVSWTASADATGVTAYDVVRNGVVVASVGGGTTAYADSGLTAATTYGYAVRARDGAGNTSGTSTVASVTTPVATVDFVVGTAPSTTTVAAGGTAGVTVTTTVLTGGSVPLVLSTSGLPVGVLATFTPATVAAGTAATLTLSTSPTTPTGTYTVTVTAGGSGVVRSTTLTLTVVASAGGPAVVQRAGAATASSATALTVTLPAPSAAGHVLVVAASLYAGPSNPVTSVTDPTGRAWTRISAASTSGHYSDGELWYTTTTGPVSSVTVHVGTATAMAATVLELSGVSTTVTVDSSAAASGTGTAAASGTATVSAPSEIVIGFVAGHAVNQAITVTSPGFTALAQQTSSGTIASVVAAVRSAPATGPTSLAATFPSAMYWAAGLVVLRAGA